MPFNQRLTGKIEPPGLAEAPATARLAFYEAAGPVTLARLAIQSGRAIGSNNRVMKPRKEPVLPDGADGPVMQPHYDESRVITLSDYKATANGLLLFWHAGTGHRSYRAALARARRKKDGKKPATFTEILGFHADGLVPNAPVRDVRLSWASIREIKRDMARWWAEHGRRQSRIGRVAEEAYPLPPTPPPAPGPRHGYDVPPGPPPDPYKALRDRKISRARERTFTPPPIPKPLPVQTKAPGPFREGPHPTPTHPIPVIHGKSTGREKGRVFVVTGKDRARYGPTGRPPGPPPRPKAPPRPPGPPPAPKALPGPVAAPVVPPVAPPAPTPFAESMSRARAYADSKGVALVTHGGMLTREQWPPGQAPQVLAYFNHVENRVVINHDQPYWQDAEEGAKKLYGKHWMSTYHPDHMIHHEVGHALHFRDVGMSEWLRIKAMKLTPDQEALVREKLGIYAATAPVEVVSETYARLAAGMRVDPEIMALYKSLKGPMP